MMFANTAETKKLKTSRKQAHVILLTRGQFAQKLTMSLKPWNSFWVAGDDKTGVGGPPIAWPQYVTQA